MAVYASVVEKGSLTRAAEAQGLTKSTISQQLKAFEDELGVQLLNRSTRSLHLTEEGAKLYRAARSMLDIAHQAFDDIATTHDGPVGSIRLTAPHNLGVMFLDQCIVEFRQRYPNVVFDLVLDDNIVATIEEGFDLALRVGWMRDSSLFSRKLSDFEMLVCASTAYLQAHEGIDGPQDLPRHEWISIKQLGFRNAIAVTDNLGRREEVKINTCIETNSGLAAREFILRGGGIGVLPSYAIRSELDAGTLTRVLPDWHLETAAIFAVFPDRDHMANRIRLFVDYLAERAEGLFSETANTRRRLPARPAGTLARRAQPRLRDAPE